jgi:crotonobetainyl-CoA:carnitine CoA-transferase CaiB-like acyl-CoA transferase
VDIEKKKGEGMTEKALYGVKALELATFVAGPYCSKLFADLGAEVIKVEQPGVGDEARRRGPFPNDIPHHERSGLFLYLNTNKLGVTLNVGSHVGREIFKQLVKWADILVEDNPPTEMKQLGFDYETLQTINPRLITTSITPFGQTGPYKDYKAYGLNISHASGSGYVTPVHESESELGPIKAGGFFEDYCHGLSAAAATLTALYYREMTGQGQHVDVSKQEASLCLDRDSALMRGPEGNVFTRVRNVGAGGFYPTRDGYGWMALIEDRHWNAFRQVMGDPEWTKDEKFNDRYSREMNVQELSSHLGEWTKKFDTETLYHKIQSVGIPSGVVRSPGDIMEHDQQFKARGFFVGIDHPVVGTLTYPSAPYIMSETPWTVERPAPMLGEHNEAVYCGLLGHSRQELVKLREAGAI